MDATDRGWVAVADELPFWKPPEVIDDRQARVIAWNGHVVREALFRTHPGRFEDGDARWYGWFLQDGSEITPTPKAWRWMPAPPTT